ncbi:urease accessory protein UreF [Blautia sp. CLA-JM-H16]|jgi:urease accessory protein|uniref:Urease accessory protein UreF n=1 Tax=Blautia aquisgranensis TaxID=3133153 RepID=A0ABV1BEL4_9FIRM
MDKKNEIRRFFLLQVNDALFPIGGYSHSQGLETYIQQGRVHDEKTAAEYIRKKLKYNLAYTDLLGVRLAYEYALKEDVNALDMLEEILGASRIPMEQREASRKMGSRFTKTIQKLPEKKLPMKKKEIFDGYMEARKGKPVSHCCAYGVFCAALGLEEEETLSHYLYAQTSAMVTNCVKTIPLSQSAGQKLLCGCYEEFEEILSHIRDYTEEDLCLSAPGFDIRGIQHEKLYSRLYMS